MNFLRFSIVGLAHEFIASISPELKCTTTSDELDWSSMPEVSDTWPVTLARNETLMLSRKSRQNEVSKLVNTVF